MIFMAMGGSTMAPKAKAAASETAKAAARIARIQICEERRYWCHCDHGKFCAQLASTCIWGDGSRYEAEQVDWSSSAARLSASEYFFGTLDAALKVDQVLAFKRWRQLTTVFPSSRGGRAILCGGWMPDKMSGLATCIPFGWTCNFGAGNLPGGAIFIGASMLYMLDAIYSGWWCGTCFIFHNIWDVILPDVFHMFQDG